MKPSNHIFLRLLLNFAVTPGFPHHPSSPQFPSNSDLPPHASIKRLAPASSLCPILWLPVQLPAHRVPPERINWGFLPKLRVFRLTSFPIFRFLWKDSNTENTPLVALFGWVLFGLAQFGLALFGWVRFGSVRSFRKPWRDKQRLAKHKNEYISCLFIVDRGEFHLISQRRPGLTMRPPISVPGTGSGLSQSHLRIAQVFKPSRTRPFHQPWSYPRWWSAPFRWRSTSQGL